jgi:hypothetical protein
MMYYRYDPHRKADARAGRLVRGLLAVHDLQILDSRLLTFSFQMYFALSLFKSYCAIERSFHKQPNILESTVHHGVQSLGRQK